MFKLRKLILALSKRKRFVITSIVLSLGFIALQLVGESNRFLSIGTLSALTILLFAWSLFEGLGLNLTLLTLVLPFLFTLGVGLFWFLLPANVFARIPIVIFYGTGIYSLCLTANIYTVSAIRTIALFRAARGVGFVLTLITSFLLFDTILSLRAEIWVSGLLIFFVALALFLQGFWVVLLKRDADRSLLIFTIISSLILVQIATGLFFWPVSVAVGSLFLTVTLYMLLGLGQAEVEARLFPQTVREYLTVGMIVFVGMFFATHWGG
jgi:hypothetical protein